MVVVSVVLTGVDFMVSTDVFTTLVVSTTLVFSSLASSSSATSVLLVEAFSLSSVFWRERSLLDLSCSTGETSLATATSFVVLLLDFVLFLPEERDRERVELFSDFVVRPRLPLLDRDFVCRPLLLLLDFDLDCFFLAKKFVMAFLQ